VIHESKRRISPRKAVDINSDIVEAAGQTTNVESRYTVYIEIPACRYDRAGVVVDLPMYHDNLLSTILRLTNPATEERDLHHINNEGPANMDDGAKTATERASHILQRTGTNHATLVNDEARRANILSKKEIEVLNWIKEGKTRWETAIILSVREETIKSHLKNIFRKLNVTNKAQAITIAIRLGLIHTD